MAVKSVTKIVNCGGQFHIYHQDETGHRFLPMTHANLLKATSRIVDMDDVRIFAQEVRKQRDLTRCQMLEVLNMLREHPQPEYTEVIERKKPTRRRMSRR